MKEATKHPQVKTQQACPALVKPRHCGSIYAFTMTEVLVGVAIISILGALIASTTGAALQSAARVREANAAKNLIAAYSLAAVEQDGIFLPGYDSTVGEVHWPTGVSVYGPVASRYPYRLGPYYNYQLNGHILVNENTRQVNAEDTYSVSLSPAFGINYLFVGGEKSSGGETTISSEVASRSAHGANLLVFASAGRKYGNSITHGFNLLTPPRIYGPMWVGAKWEADANPGNYGHVHARHKNKAVCAFLDGSVRLLGVEELRDMRLWSLRAAENNDPNYSVTASSGGGRR
jgi:prepilin-type N-terminal cleavage/methylation domain-containing protein/prepilin-type processing-associated H-X9-DG protein